MKYDDLLKMLKAAGSGFVGGVMGLPADTAVAATNLSRAAYGYGGHKLGLLSAGQMPEPIEPKNVPGTSAHLSGLLGVGDSTGEAIAEFAGGLLSPGPKKAPKKMDWTAYHGSPHKFDKFSLDKIGTGEGAQAYGHGLYFAESPETAKYYRDTLTQNFKGDGTQRNFWLGWAMKEANNDSAQAIDILTKKTAAYDAGKKPFGVPEKDAAYRASLEEALQSARASQGHLYKVDIDDTRAPKDAFLDWDKPLKDQPKILSALEKAGVFTGRKKFDGWDALIGPGGTYVNPADSAQRAYIAAQQTLGADKATEVFRKAGIPGIRYLDAGSRGSGGTYNTVLFDDSLVKILERQ